MESAAHVDRAVKTADTAETNANKVQHLVEVDQLVPLSSLAAPVDVGLLLLVPYS